MNLSIILSISYLIFTFIVMIWFGRKKKSGNEEFYVSQGDMGILMIMSLVFSTIISSSNTIGASTIGFTTGISSVWANWGQALGILFFFLISARFFRRAYKARGALTVASAFGHVFGRRSRIAITIISAFSYLLMFGVGPVAFASVFGPVLGVDRQIIIWVVGVIFVLMAAFVGLKGLAAFNIVNTFMIIGVLTIISIMAINKAGGFVVIRNSLPDSYFDLFQPSMATAVAGGLGTAISGIAANIYATTTIAAKSPKVNYIGQGLVILILIPFAIFVSFIGIAGKVIMPDAEAATIVYSVANHISPVLVAFMSMAVMAANFSTTPSILFLGSTTLVKDCYLLIKPGATEKEEMRAFRIITIVIGMFFVYLGSSSASVLSQILGAFQIRAVVGIAIAFGLYWKKVSEDAIFWSMVIGGIVSAIWFFVGNPFRIAPLWPGAFVVSAVIIIMTLMNKEAVSSIHSRYLELRDVVD